LLAQAEATSRAAKQIWKGMGWWGWLGLGIFMAS